MQYARMTFPPPPHNPVVALPCVSVCGASPRPVGSRCHRPLVRSASVVWGLTHDPASTPPLSTDLILLSGCAHRSTTGRRHGRPSARRARRRRLASGRRVRKGPSWLHAGSRRRRSSSGPRSASRSSTATPASGWTGFTARRSGARASFGSGRLCLCVQTSPQAQLLRPWHNESCCLPVGACVPTQ